MRTVGVKSLWSVLLLEWNALAGYPRSPHGRRWHLSRGQGADMGINWSMLFICGV